MLSDKEIEEIIVEEFNNLRNMVLSKNKRYKNSVFYPQRIFSNSNSLEQIKVRIDDKISRIQNMESSETDFGDESYWDSVQDLAGYLILLNIARKIHYNN